MNIAIYYLSKKIVLQLANQNAQNQLFKKLDNYTTKEIVDEFEKFADQNEVSVLTFLTQDLNLGLEKFKKAFKFIEAAGGLIENNEKWLFIYRLKRWDLPKGKLDKGETPEIAAIRECEEECGITQLSINKVLEPTYHIYPHKGKFALKKTYWYKMSTLHTSALVPQIEESIEKVEWFTKDEIKKQVIHNSYPAILDVIAYLLN